MTSKKTSTFTTYGMLLVIIVVIVGILAFIPEPKQKDNTVSQSELKKFASYEEMKNFLKEQSEASKYGYFSYGAESQLIGVQKTATGLPMAASEAGADDYSTTNIQVSGVDEADIVKNDGKYIYTLSGNKLVIVDAYPAENMNILSETDVGSAREIFINKDRLVVFGYVSQYPVIREGMQIQAREYYPYSQKTFVKVYDISDHSQPVLKRNLTLDGSYFDSRMIGDYVYVILNTPAYYKEDMPVPILNPQQQEFPEIYYFDIPDYSYTLTNVVAVNTQNDEDITNKAYLLGSTANIFVSQKNIYITYMTRLDPYYIQEKMIDAVVDVLPVDTKNKINEIKNSDIPKNEKYKNMMEVLNNWANNMSSDERKIYEKQLQEKMTDVQREMSKQMEMTIIHRISIDNGKISYESNGKVPGRVLNQFSMDEYNDYFRIATTSGHVARMSGQATSANHVYVLDMSLNTVGKIEDIAPGERIYSARFMGDRAYMVTFRKVDPLFVIDMKDPTNPRILGKLKIPGYSDYLHPYDENHIIGLGKEAVAAEQGDFSWYQGVKLSLFDVTDVTKPKEIAKYEIGDRGTDSNALHDHKAFLFSKAKNLLVIPITLAEIDEEKYPQGVPDNAYGEYIFQGAYVFDITLENGFVLKGRVSHVDDDSLEKSGYYYYSSSAVKRSLYMDDILYTLSNEMIKANSLDNLEEINKVELPFESEYRGYPIEII